MLSQQIDSELMEQLKEFNSSPFFFESPGIIYWKDLQGQYLGANNYFLKITGLSSLAELVGKTDQDLMWKERSETIRNNDLIVLQTGQTLQVEEALFSEEGNVNVFIIIRKPIKNKQGKICGLIANGIDITSIKTLELQLQQDKNKIEIEKNIVVSYLNNIVACTPGHLYWKDMEGRYLGANEFFLQVAGLKSINDLLGKTDSNLPWKEQCEELRKNDLEVMIKEKIINIEETAILANQTKRIFMAAKMPLRNINGEVIGVIGNSLDITSQKTAEENLKYTKEQLEKANRAKTEFLQNMRHDFLTPFSGILGLADFLYQNEEESEKKGLLHSIVMSAKTLLEQLNGITDFLAIAEGGFAILEKPFDIYKIMMDLKNMLLSSAQEKSLKFTVETDKEVPKYIIGDDVRTQRILMNLLANAIKFTNTGSVLLQASIVKENKNNNSIIIKFKVKDTGIGMSKKNQEVIFEKFTNLSPSYNGVHFGSGLGLKIVKKFLGELGGEIHVASKRNKGTTFIVLIPYKLLLLNCAD